MEVFLIVFGVMAFFVVALSVGVLMGREPLSGSCGGMKKLGMDVACEICGGDQSKCEKEQKKNASAKQTDLGYDATTKQF